jgi:hypothetical protein
LDTHYVSRCPSHSSDLVYIKASLLCTIWNRAVDYLWFVSELQSLAAAFKEQPSSTQSHCHIGRLYWQDVHVCVLKMHLPVLGISMHPMVHVYWQDACVLKMLFRSQIFSTHARISIPWIHLQTRCSRGLVYTSLMYPSLVCTMWSRAVDLFICGC